MCSIHNGGTRCYKSLDERDGSELPAKDLVKAVELSLMLKIFHDFKKYITFSCHRSNINSKCQEKINTCVILLDKSNQSLPLCMFLYQNE